MSNGLEAMQQQRAQTRRGKPASRHPRTSEQHDDSDQQDTTTGAGEQQEVETGQTNTSVSAEVQTQKASSSRKHSPSSRSKTSSTETTQPATSASTGVLEGKAANSAALGWAAGARKLAERADYLTRAVRVAHEAGTPAEQLQAMLERAEQDAAGIELPPEAWRAAGLEPPATLSDRLK